MILKYRISTKVTEMDSKINKTSTGTILQHIPSGGVSKELSASRPGDIS